LMRLKGLRFRSTVDNYAQPGADRYAYEADRALFRGDRL
jgi:hypothetical protein